ncbi:MAG: hypothetical protein FJ144_28325 [Deltaproteobacteria bacterium]|nr:hypothetical protein [Deltaproteobacteria bacterium]
MTKRPLPLLPAMLWLLASASPGSSATYDCPSDPGFCYFDVANDGCFDAGTDTGPIDAQLEAGSFPNPLPPGSGLPTDPGSIICPPSVGGIEPVADVDWRTALGSHVRLFAADVVPAANAAFPVDVHIHSGGELLSQGAIEKNQGFVWLRAEGDVEVNGDLKPSPLDSVAVDSSGASILIGEKVQIQGREIALNADQDLTLSHRVSIRERSGGNPGLPLLVAGGDLRMTNPTLQLRERLLEVEAANIRVIGKATVKNSGTPVPAAGHPCSVAFDAAPGGSIEIDRMALKAVGILCFSGGSLEIVGGGAGASTFVLGNHPNGPTSVQISVTGAVDLDRVTFVSPNVEIATSGTEVDLTNGTLKAPGSSPGSTTITTGPASTCDLTGTRLKNMALTENCGTLIGP